MTLIPVEDAGHIASVLDALGKPFHGPLTPNPGSVGRHVIRKRRKLGGWWAGGRKCALNLAEVSAIRHRKSRGEKVRELAEAFEVSTATIYKYLRRES